MKRLFTWDAWDYDCSGEAYIIAKDQCPNAANVPNYICEVDYIDPACRSEMQVEEGWCKFQVRSDWEDGDGKPCGGYVVYKQKEPPKNRSGKKQSGWFPVWIVHKDEWY